MRSIKIRSTGDFRIVWTTWVAVPSSQRTFRSVSCSRVRLRPNRKTGWSSTIPRRIGWPPVIGGTPDPVTLSRAFCSRAPKLCFYDTRFRKAEKNVFHRSPAKPCWEIQRRTASFGSIRIKPPGFLATVGYGNRFVQGSLELRQRLRRQWCVFEPHKEGVGDLVPDRDLALHRPAPVRLRPRRRREPARDEAAKRAGDNLKQTRQTLLRPQPCKEETPKTEFDHHPAR